MRHALRGEGNQLYDSWVLQEDCFGGEESAS